MKEIKKVEAICKRLFLLMNTVLIAEKNEENAQVNESSSKYTVTESINMKDIFKYE